MGYYSAVGAKGFSWDLAGVQLQSFSISFVRHMIISSFLNLCLIISFLIHLYHLFSHHVMLSIYSCISDISFYAILLNLKSLFGIMGILALGSILVWVLWRDLSFLVLPNLLENGLPLYYSSKCYKVCIKHLNHFQNYYCQEYWWAK